MSRAARQADVVKRAPAPGMALLLGLLGCTANIGQVSPPPAVDAGAGAGPSDVGPQTSSLCAQTLDTSPVVLRRLSRAEYQLTLQQLLQLPAVPAVDKVPLDSSHDGFKTVAAIQGISDEHLRAYLQTAEELALQLTSDGTRRDAVVGCAATTPGCLESFAARFGRLAYRRPLEPSEAADLITRAKADATDANEQLQYVITALLTSPSFLFRVEVGQAGPAGAPATLTAEELASRLSFALWGRGPTAQLLDRAQRGELDSPAGIAALSNEMLVDPRAQEFFTDFFKQWLDFEQLRTPATPPAAWSPELIPDMIDETQRLLNEFAWTSPGTSFLDALTANHTYVSGPLGTFYGLAGATAAPKRVDFPVGHPRARTGIFTHASLISAKSDADLIAMRGKWIRHQFLCQNVEVPPGLLEGLQGELSGLTYPQVVLKRNTQQPCASCHAMIDPIGVGFSQYDDTGHFDATVSTTEFGIVPRFEGATNPDFKSIAELAAEIRSSPELAGCIAQKAFLYTHGRVATEADSCTVTSATESFTKQGYSFRALITGMVQSPTFRLRRAPQ